MVLSFQRRTSGQERVRLVLVNSFLPHKSSITLLWLQPDEFSSQTGDVQTGIFKVPVART